MKKLAYVLAALGAIVIAAPSVASAETIVIKRGGHGWHHGHGYHQSYGARAQMHRGRHVHRGWHRGHHDRVVVIKRHRY